MANSINPKQTVVTIFEDQSLYVTSALPVSFNLDLMFVR